MRLVRRLLGYRPGALSLCIWLVVRGGMVRVALVLAALGATVSAFAVEAATRTGSSSAPQIPTTASMAIAWSAGIVLAVGGALRAMIRDRDEGIVALLQTRGVPLGSYVFARVGGLVIVLALAVVGATFVAGAAAVWMARPRMTSLAAATAALAYAVAFAATMGPVAMATLGTRNRAGGYLALLSVLIVPELLGHWTAQLLPPGWHELTSIPAALGAIQSGVTAPRTMASHLVRAALGLGALVVFCLVIVRARVPPPEKEHGT